MPKYVERTTLRAYLDEIGKVPLLTREEEVKAVERGDRDLLVSSNLRFVVTVAKKYVGCGIPLLDLISEGNIGLGKAADKYNSERGVHFTSYAVWWIRQTIRRAISEKSRIIRLPMHVGEKVSYLNRRLQSICGEERLSERQALERLALETGKSVFDLSEKLQISKCPVSLDSPLTEEEDYVLMDRVSSTYGSPTDEVVYDSLRLKINELLQTLSPREQVILECRYGLNGRRVHTLSDTGAKMGVTRERVRQI